MMTKAVLRQQSLARRRALSAEEVSRRSSQITSHFFDEVLVGTPAILIHTFLPIVRQNEVDTWPIIHRIWRDLPNGQVAVSVTDIPANRLSHYVLTPDTPLVKNRWGIPEPTPVEQSVIDSQRINLVLVPLLAFDRRGHRVGYGKGYYDRFLANCHPECLKVGLSLFEPVEQIADNEPTDVRLDICITPEQTYFF